MDQPTKNAGYSLRSWIDIPEDSDFSLYNIPFGVFKTDETNPVCCTAIGGYVVDLAALAELGLFSMIPISANTFNNACLNDFIALGKVKTNKVRERLRSLFSIDNPELRDRPELHPTVLHRQDEVTMMMPVAVGDYTDFYSSKEHATNVGSLFRDPSNALLPNWKHLPVAYHGRSSSIVVSGTPLVRPNGQFKRKKEDTAPVFGPTEALDYEVEIGFVIGKNSVLGQPVGIEKAEEYIFGFLLFNDWSARDIQSWEYVPLGPFLSKNFMSSVSPWIVTLEALAPYKTHGPLQDVEVLPYLRHDGYGNYDIELETTLETAAGVRERVGLSNFRYMYWNSCQQLAHHTVNGCNVRIGDILASGTISGPDKSSAGCLLELTRNGQAPVTLPDGSVRRFLEDGDTVTIRAHAVKEGMRVGFGSVSGTIKSQ